MAAKRKSVPEAELENEERAGIIHQVAEEISASLAAMEVEEQAVSEVESCLTYKKMALCSMNKDQLRAKLTLPNLKSICRYIGLYEAHRPPAPMEKIELSRIRIAGQVANTGQFYDDTAVYFRERIENECSET
ncbi:hypothetical protein ACROYT_G041273 [Oculina patagonica]